jgi:hypothetical protein
MVVKMYNYAVLDRLLFFSNAKSPYNQSIIAPPSKHRKIQ